MNHPSTFGPAIRPSSSPYCAPRQRSALANPFLRLAIVMGSVVAFVVVVVGGVLVADVITPPHTVLVDNGHDFAVEIEMAGDHLSLAPHTHASVRVRPGTVRAETTGPKGFRETVTLVMPEKGWHDTSRTAVYNVGGRSQLAVVTMTYGTVTAKTPPVTLLARKDKVVLLPVGSYGDIDDAFPKSIKTKGWGVSRQHVCHVDPARNTIGCPQQP